MGNVDVQIKAAQQIPLSVEKVLDGITLSTTKSVGMDVIKGVLELTMLSNVASVSSDSLYRMAVRMGYEGTEEDFLRLLMTESADGFININNKYPKASGYYTLQEAIAALSRDTTLSPEQKNGMIVTFFNGNDWSVYQFDKEYLGPQQFSEESNWRPIGTIVATSTVSGTVKMTDTISENDNRGVGDNVAVTPKAVSSFFENVDSGGLINVNNYSSLPAIGKPKSIYYLSDSELFYVYRGGRWVLMTPTWDNIKIIRGDVTIRTD